MLRPSRLKRALVWTAPLVVVLLLVTLFRSDVVRKHRTSQLVRQLEEQGGGRFPRVFIAANFYNNAEILPNFQRQLLLFVDAIGVENVFVSVFENGSTDSGETKRLLSGLDQELSNLGIARRIVADPSSKKKNRRIPYLARIRNRVLEPLQEMHGKNGNRTEFDRLLFFNDIVFQVDDVLRLLLTNNGKYDTACAMDYYNEFYDLFATRDVRGDRFSSGVFPYVADPFTQRLFRDREPVPVFSCWNGMLSMDARPFSSGLLFRALAPADQRVSMTTPVAAEASECCLIFADLWHLGYTNSFINPLVKVAYDWRSYNLQRLIEWFEPFLWLFHRPPDQPLRPTQANVLMTFYPEDRYCIQDS